MKYIILLLALMFAAPVFAQEAHRSPSERLTEEVMKMDDAQKEEALRAIKAKESPSAAAAREWIAIGEGLGAGLAATAEKLGVVANDFAKSPVGKMAMFLIIWNYMGDDISGWLGGLLILLVFLPFWFYNFRKSFGEYNEKGKFLHYDKEMLSDRSNHAGLVAIYVVALGLIAVVSIIFIA